MDTQSLIDLLKKLVIPGYATIAEFKKVAQQWLQKYSELRQIPDNQLTPELRAKKADLLARGDSIMKKIESLGITADALNGVNSQLGFAQIVAAGVIVVAAGMMLYWTYDFVKFRDKLNEYKSMRASGMTHQQATDAIKVIEGGIFSNIEGASKWLGIGALGVGLIYLGKKQGWF